MSAPLRVLSIASLFPDRSRPGFGLFVAKSLAAAAQAPDIHLSVTAPVGLPPFPLSRHPHYAPLAALPSHERWDRLDVARPRFFALPGSNGRFSAAAMARAVLPIARAIDPHVIDAQFLFPDGVAAMIVAQRLGVPFVAKARGADVSYWPHQPRVADQIAQLSQSADRLLAVSAALRDDMIALGMPANRIAVHHTGLDAALFRPMDRASAKSALGLSGPVIATVGALIDRKAQQQVLRALPMLPGVTYVMAGTGVREGSYRALAATLGVGDRVRFLGQIPQADLPRLYAAADCVVMPSISEGIANAWVEALACGTPLVLSDIGGARELVTSPTAGRIVPPTPEAIADAVRAIMAAAPAQADVAASLGSRFRWDRNGRELAACWRSLAGRQ